MLSAASDCILKIKNPGYNADLERQSEIRERYLEEERQYPPKPPMWEMCEVEDASYLSPLEKFDQTLFDYDEYTHLFAKEAFENAEEAGHAEAFIVKKVDGRLVKDDSMKKIEMHQSPYSAHVKLLLYFGGHPSIGSGTFISPKHILTVGHNLYETIGIGRDAGKRIWADKIIVVPAASHDGFSPLGEYKAISGYCHPKWIEAPHRQNDVAILEIAEDLSEIVGYKTVGILEGNVARQEVILTGYPKEKGKGKIIKYPGSPKERLDSQVGLWEREGQLVSHSTDQLLRYRIPTYGGQSGCGVLKRHPNGVRVLVGVHSGAPQEKKYREGEGALFNEGVRITEEKWQWIQSILEGKYDTSGNAYKKFEDD